MPRRYLGNVLSGTYVPSKVPDAPVAVSAIAGNTQALVFFTAPGNTGGSAITLYTVMSSGGQTATGTSSPIMVSGLSNGTGYTFTVNATNTFGSGPYSAPSSSVTPASGVLVQYLVVAGGGGGGWNRGGGGGGGGFLTSWVRLAAGTHTITVGGGGTGATSSGQSGVNGSNSDLAGVTATGGGGGGGDSSTQWNGKGGGSGGGCQAAGVIVGRPVAGQGYSGGTTNSGYALGGGGGGAGSVGSDGGAPNYGLGGSGAVSTITGSYYAGGGGGGYNAASPGPNGGIGGGGSGGLITSDGTSGTANTGGGGGGGGAGGYGRGNGGSGIVIVRSPQLASSTTGSPTVSISGGYIIYSFTSSGSITF